MKREGTRDAHVTLKIPRPLYEQLKQVIQGSGFHSVTEFAVYVMRDLVSHRSEAARYGLQPDPDTAGPEKQEDIEPLSPDEIEAIRKRLTSLGYL
ncbi:MAG: CopG family transcriptional regulator [Actinomycetota bacterium]|nr:CopG family transcriptional regulator [Actinomycetota bacterium]